MVLKVILSSVEKSDSGFRVWHQKKTNIPLVLDQEGHSPLRKKKKHCQIKHAKLLWRRHVNTETAESTFFGGGGFPLKNKLNESHHTLMKVFTLG